MGQKTSKPASNEFDGVVPHPSARAETSLGQIAEEPSTPGKVAELTEELIEMIKDTKSPLTLAQFQEKISHLDFTEECNEDDGGETDDKITPEEYEDKLMKVEHLLQEGASGLPFDDDMESSALLECILRNKADIFRLILFYRPQDLHQKCNGLTILETTVVYQRLDMFLHLVTNFNDEINTETSGTMAALIKLSTEFGWTEDLFGKWYRSVEDGLNHKDLSSLKLLTEPQFLVALELFPDLMEEVRLHLQRNQTAAEDLV